MDLFVQTIINGLILGSGYALVAVGLTVIFGTLHIVNFAHGAFFALGAYGVLLLQNTGLGYLVAIPLAVVGVAVIGYLLEVTIVRRALYDRGEHGSIIITFALSQAIVASIILIVGPDPLPVRSPFGQTAISVFGFFLSAQRVFIAVTSVIVLTAFAWWLRHSVRGQQILAVSQNAKGALYSGINVPFIRSFSFLLGISAAGLAGALLAPLIAAFPTMGDANVIVAFTVVILGGLGSIGGAMLGAMVIGLSNALFETYVSVSWTPALGWMLVIFVLLFWPQGLLGRAQINRH
ncbi:MULTISPECIES: branched-chain amino acid ABC transporter permease [unclassified Chelatococcus]|uniref:branched-chain amino acid ABC transporter permease n=1 Tax=unclassified Chelatococcus TaxID=2638111 RepID=UPI001BCE7B32|nr:MULTISPECIES: branched-chain amino acid ABC transporter permease [unclassified Chelatococcus]MBS7701401.1 branched-chain amino acid ABC transporter permease [Chelatococcus sp. YT9]MBX3557481.1 branched-chain amino acid ABC transporter permease [Chelatococcus sp.]